MNLSQLLRRPEDYNGDEITGETIGYQWYGRNGGGGGGGGWNSVGTGRTAEPAGGEYRLQLLPMRDYC